MGRKLDLSKLTDEEARHVWEVIQRDFDLRKKEEERLEVVKIGSLEWFYEHVRTRFKRFGSAKVMRSLYGRLQPGQNLDPELLGLHDRFSSLPNINREYLRQVDADMFPNDIAEDDDEAQRYSLSFSEFSGPGKDTLQKESMIAEAELAAMFHHILQEQGHTMEPPDQEFSTEVRLTVNSRRRSTDSTHRLDTNTVQEQPQVARTTAPTKGALPSIEHRPQYSGDMDTSEEETKGAPRFPAYHPHHFKRRSRTSSQESGPHSGVQSPSLEPQTDADLEEVTLKRKLGELASNISDKEVSSEEEPEKKVSYKPVLSSSSDDLPTEAQKVYLTAGKTFGLERRLQSLEEKAQQSGTTDSELSELEIGIASSAAIVQQTESEVSDIESRIAALSAAGMTVSPADKPKRRSTTQTSIPSSPSTANAVPSPGSRQHEPLEIPNLPSTEEVKVTPMQQALRKKFNVSLGMSDSPDGFDRNAIYRGSLTQRNPNGKNKKLDRIFAKPVLTHR